MTASRAGGVILGSLTTVDTFRGSGRDPLLTPPWEFVRIASASTPSSHLSPPLRFAGIRRGTPRSTGPDVAYPGGLAGADQAKLASPEDRPARSPGSGRGRRSPSQPSLDRRSVGQSVVTALMHGAHAPTGSGEGYAVASATGIEFRRGSATVMGSHRDTCDDTASVTEPSRDRWSASCSGSGPSIAEK